MFTRVASQILRQFTTCDALNVGTTGQTGAGEALDAAGVKYRDRFYLQAPACCLPKLTFHHMTGGGGGACALENCRCKNSQVVGLGTHGVTGRPL